MHLHVLSHNKQELPMKNNTAQCHMKLFIQKQTPFLGSQKNYESFVPFIHDQRPYT